MHSIVVALIMLLAVAVSGYLVRALPFSIPLPLVQIAMGAMITGVIAQGEVLEPEVFFLLFLPPLLFLDGWRIPKSGLLRDSATIFGLTLGLIVFTVIGAGFLIHWLVPSMPLAVAFALAAIVSPTDPVAVSSITARCSIPKRMKHILEGESLLNDATGLVCFRFAVAAAMTGVFSLSSASITFLWLALGGLSIGVLLTLAVNYVKYWLSRKVGEESGSSILVSLLIPFGAYLVAEHIHASGILAAVAAGMTMSHVELNGHTPATTRVQRAAVWDTIQFSLNGIMFVVLGEQLPGIVQRAATTMVEVNMTSPWYLLFYTIAINLALAALRCAWVWASIRLSLLRKHSFHHPLSCSQKFRIVAAMSLAGVRGVITLAGVMTLPLFLPDGSTFPARDLVIFLSAAVILVSLIGASLGLPHLLRNLEIPEEPADFVAEDLARSRCAAAAIAAVNKAAHQQVSGEENTQKIDIYTSAAMRIIANYKGRAQYGDSAQAQTDAALLHQADLAEKNLRLAALQAEREEIFQLTRQRKIGDELSRKLVHHIDLLESRYR